MRGEEVGSDEQRLVRAPFGNLGEKSELLWLWSWCHRGFENLVVSDN